MILLSKLIYIFSSVYITSIVFSFFFQKFFLSDYKLIFFKKTEELSPDYKTDYVAT